MSRRDAATAAGQHRLRQAHWLQGRPHALADQLLSDHLARYIRQPELNVTERVGRATETVPAPRGTNGALVESHSPDDRMAHACPMRGFRFFRNARRLRLRSCLRLSHLIFNFALDHTPSRVELHQRRHLRYSQRGILMRYFLSFLRSVVFAQFDISRRARASRAVH
jgi:hypothetical protein